MLDYLSVFTYVLADGEPVPTRFGPSREVRGLQVRCPAGSLYHRKGINYRLGWMELLQLVAGVFDPELIRRVAPNADHSLFTRQSAYGPRVADKLRPVLEALVDDPTTRQAVLFVANPDETGTADLPCTLSVQFLYRYGTLDALVSMRSWDLVKGLTYDLTMFGGLLQVMASSLHKVGGKLVMPGEVIVTAGSAHVYDADLDRVPTGKRATFYVNRTVSDKARWGSLNSSGRLATYVGWATGQLGADWSGGVPGGIKVVDHNRVVRRPTREGAAV